MSLTEIRLPELVKKQYFFKIEAYMNLFYGLIAAQLLASFFSFGSIGGMSTSTGNVNFFQNKYSSDIIIIFTIIWIFIISISLTQNSYRNIDFSFISNRVSSNLSNIWFLLTVGVVSGISVTLSSFLLRVIMYFLKGSKNILIVNFYISPKYMIISFIAASLYMILFGAMGYLLGMLMKLSKIFIIIIPALFIASIYFETLKRSQIKVLSKLIYFFAHENSLFIFSIKTLIAAIILFAVGIYVSNRTEVR